MMPLKMNTGNDAADLRSCCPENAHYLLYFGAFYFTFKNIPSA